MPNSNKALWVLDQIRALAIVAAFLGALFFFFREMKRCYEFCYPDNSQYGIAIVLVLISVILLGLPSLLRGKSRR